MRETPERSRICQAALRLVAHRRLERARGSIGEPDAWLATTERNLRAEHWDTVVAMADEDPGLTETDLADALDPEGARPSLPDPTPSPSSALAVFEAEPWEPLTEAEQEHARSKLATIRAGLAGTPKENPHE